LHNGAYGLHAYWGSGGGGGGSATSANSSSNNNYNNYNSSGHHPYNPYSGRAVPPATPMVAHATTTMAEPYMSVKLSFEGFCRVTFASVHVVCLGCGSACHTCLV
jgi:hypothetical protein